MTTAPDIPLLAQLNKPAHWLVTGGAGFIGSHLIETLLREGQKVTCLDNFSTGTRKNLESSMTLSGQNSENRLSILEGDIRDSEMCKKAVRGVDHILHQAALASVPASLINPKQFHEVNVGGTLAIWEAARAEGIPRVVYASSSAVYGDDPLGVKTEDSIGNPLSPYAATKAVMETWAKTYASCYGMEFVGLRYFNVYGTRQDPNGPYAAVIPIWEKALRRGESAFIFGDGKTTRDFVEVSDVVRINITAALAPLPANNPAVALNVGTGEETSLLRLHLTMQTVLRERENSPAQSDPVFKDFRDGDIRKSVASLTRLEEVLGITPQVSLSEGMRKLLA